MIVTAKIAGVGAMLSSGGMVISQVVPLPDNFQAWPVTAMLAFISLTCIAVVVFCVKKAFAVASESAKAMTAQAVAQTKLADAIMVTNTRMDEMAQKQGVTSENISNLVIELKARRKS